MSAIILLEFKQQPVKRIKEFVDQADVIAAMKKMVMLHQAPRIYYTDKSMPPNELKSLVDMLKALKDYQMVVSKIHHKIF